MKRYHSILLCRWIHHSSSIDLSTAYPYDWWSFFKTLKMRLATIIFELFRNKSVSTAFPGPIYFSWTDFTTFSKSDIFSPGEMFIIAVVKMHNACRFNLLLLWNFVGKIYRILDSKGEREIDFERRFHYKNFRSVLSIRRQ